MRKRICLLTTTHLTDDPRLVKEAEAFQNCGYDVTVVACKYNSALSESDREITERAAWSVRLVCWDPVENPLLFWLSRIRRIVCLFSVSLLRRGGTTRGLEWLEIRAFERVLPEIMREAQKVNADLFVGHNPGLIPVAWKVARDSGAKCGFDAEDFHSGMKRIDERCSLQDETIRIWEKRYLIHYDCLTAAAPLIAREYMDQYAISIDAVVLNAFDPVCRADEITKPGDALLSLYWISQTIGAHRGLEDVARALALLEGAPVRVFLRGEWQKGYENRFRTLLDELCVPQGMVVSLPRVTYAEFVKSATQYDVGLAVEEPTSRNRELCLTNKILMYLSAGLAVAATGTPAQTDFMEKIPKAGFVFPWGGHRNLAGNLNGWIENPDQLRNAKAAAFRAAKEHFNWERERMKLERVVRNVLP